MACDTRRTGFVRAAAARRALALMGPRCSELWCSLGCKIVATLSEPVIVATLSEPVIVAMLSEPVIVAVLKEPAIVAMSCGEGLRR